MKWSIDDLFKHPVMFLIVIIVGAYLSFFFSFNNVSQGYVDSKVKDAMQNMNEKIIENDKRISSSQIQLSSELSQIKATLREIDKNILDIYKDLKLQEGKYGKY